MHHKEPEQFVMMWLTGAAILLAAFAATNIPTANLGHNLSCFLVRRRGSVPALLCIRALTFPRLHFFISFPLAVTPQVYVWSRTYEGELGTCEAREQILSAARPPFSSPLRASLIVCGLVRPRG